MIADATEPHQRTHAYALLMIALAVGNMGAGLIADAVGHSGLRWLFVAMRSGLACALIVRLALPGDDLRPARVSRSPGSAGRPGPCLRVALAGPGATGHHRCRHDLRARSTCRSCRPAASLSAHGLNPASAGLVTRRPPSRSS